MFSKALFKQSMKANWVKWLCVTLPTVIMLAIVIVVLGNLGINDIRDSLSDVFTQADQESYLKENSIDSYNLYLSSVELEGTFQNMDESTLTLVYDYILTPYNQAIDEYKNANDGQEPTGEALETIRNQTIDQVKILLSLAPQLSFLTSDQQIAFLTALYTTYDQDRFTSEDAEFADKSKALLKEAYLGVIYQGAYAQALEQETTMQELAAYSATLTRTMIEQAMASYTAPEGEFDAEPYKEAATTAVNQMMHDVTYKTYYDQSVVGGMTDEEAGENAELYAVTVKVLSNTAISTYELWLAELGDVEGAQEQAYTEATASITDQIPEKVSEALSELGNMDIYSLIIGSIFYRIAGLLLPMVFVIMTANGLLAGQVDSGSMAYVLSTPTKRRTVAVTQMVYLVVALFAMFALLTVTSVIAVWISGGNAFAINYGQILLYNLGAFLTMFAFAGFCYMCSAIFNRTKYSMGVGGGITIFSLVCTILGLFGSNVIPSAMRISAMNFFNYLSIITLYDITAIMTGSLSYLWKFGILLAIGIVTFIIGIFRFDKKDLPL